MNYQKIYDQLIEKRRKYPLTKNKKDPNYIYCECHHIILKSLGGSDSEDNLINLTAREHFIAHYLLWKINPCDQTLLALMIFKKGNLHVHVKRNFKTSKLYESARIAFHEWNVRVHTGKKQSQEQIEHRAKLNTGKKRSLETRKLQSEHCWCKGKKLSKELRLKISIRTKAAMKNIDPKKLQQARQKAADKLRGKRLSTEHRKKLSEGRKGLHWWNNGQIAIQRKTCPGKDWQQGNLKKSK